MAKKPAYPAIMSLTQASEMLGKPAYWVRDLSRVKQIPGAFQKKKGGKWYYRRVALEKFLGLIEEYGPDEPESRGDRGDGPTVIPDKDKDNAE